MQSTPTALDLGAIVTGLGGGLALFLFGMRQMTESLKTVAGASMTSLLSRLTANRFTGALAGAVVTAVIQSSSVTTVLVVGFLTAGLLTFPRSIGIILGANVGTTITAQIVAFRIDKYGLLIIAIGFLLNVASRRVSLRQWGMALMGLGLIFFGMDLMTSAMGPLRTYPPFIDVMASLENPLLGILAGFLFTGLIQSSSATTGLVIVLAGEGLITLESGVALVMGANVGTCVTAVLSAVGRPRAAVQAAGVHVVFNVLGVAAWLLFIPQLADLARSFSPGDAGRQIANAHSIFNLANCFVFIWFTGPLARMVERIVPSIVTAEERGRPRYLDEYFISQAPLALDHVRMELVRLGQMVGAMLRDSLPAILSPRIEPILRLGREDRDVNTLHGAIVLYLGRISQENLADAQAKLTYENLMIANHLETTGDIVDKNLLEVGRKRLDQRITISSATRELLEELHRKVCSGFDDVVAAIESGDVTLARKVVATKADVNATADAIMQHLADRLVAREPNRLASFSVEADIVENLKRLNNLTRRIARVVIEAVDRNTDQPAEDGEVRTGAGAEPSGGTAGN
jgi:phosphate:Na+ symporter